ncbi:MAG: PEGA domain-containing protein, partial [Methanomicrobiales archaeon]
MVNSDPTGATVTLNNGVYSSITPADIQKVPPGTYTLKITKPGYISYKNENFIVMQGQPNTVFQALSK